jgi:hypothetical protein
MARSIAATALLALLLGGVSCERGDRALARRWLLRNCTVTEQRELEAQVKRRGGALEPLLLEAFVTGPPQRDVNALLAEVERTYQRRQKWLAAVELTSERGQKRRAAGGVSGLSPELVEALRKVSLAEERQRAASRLDHNYRAAALAGLALIGRPEGKQLLERLAAEHTSPFRYLAEPAAGKRPRQ